MSLIVERFEAAIQKLLGDGPVKTRLGAAYAEHLEDLEQVELPVADMNEFSELHVAMHSVAPVGRLSAVSASIQKMSPAEAARHARTILRIYAQLLAMEQSARIPAASAIEPVEDLTQRILAKRRR